MEVPFAIIPETKNDPIVIHFEPGAHPLTEQASEAVYKDFSQGNLDAHGWNTEVGERIASYAYNAPALLLTIDGLEPIPSTPAQLFSPLQEASILWTHLPARPNRLHYTGQAYIVKGDNLYAHIPQTVLPNEEEQNRFYKRMQAQEAIDATKANTTRGAGIGEETAGIAALGAALWGASKFFSPSGMEQRLTRRKFLSNTIATVAATMTVGSISRIALPDAISNMSTEPTKDFLQMVANVVRPRITRSAFSDGRTALLLAKAEDGQAVLAEEMPTMTNVVIMGNGHVDIASTYMEGKQERNTAIAAFAQEVISIAKQVYEDYYHLSLEQLPPQVLQTLLNYVSQVDIVKVTDPGGSSFQPNFPPTVDHHVTLIKSLNSSQVETAIKDLRPQQ